MIPLNHSEFPVNIQKIKITILSVTSLAKIHEISMKSPFNHHEIPLKSLQTRHLSAIRTVVVVPSAAAATSTRPWRAPRPAPGGCGAQPSGWHMSGVGIDVPFWGLVSHQKKYLLEMKYPQLGDVRHWEIYQPLIYIKPGILSSPNGCLTGGGFPLNYQNMTIGEVPP